MNVQGPKKLSTGTNTRIPLCPVFALLLSKNYRSKWSTPKKKIKIECSILNMDSIDQPLDVLPKKRKSNWTIYIYRRYVQTVGYAWATFPSINILFAIFCYFHIQVSFCTFERQKVTSSQVVKLSKISHPQHRLLFAHLRPSARRLLDNFGLSPWRFQEFSTEWSQSSLVIPSGNLT